MPCNALCMFYIYFSFTFIIEYNPVLPPESRLGYSLQLSRSDGTITFHLPLHAFRPSEQFEPGKISRYIQIINITEYLSRLKFVLYFFQLLLTDKFLLQAIQFFPNGRR